MERPPGLPSTLDYPEVPVGAILAGSERRFGTRTAFAQNGSELTFVDLAVRARRFAAGLSARGVGRGDVVALHLPNCLAFPVAYYGTLLAGATFSPANPLLPPDDLAFQLGDCGAAAVVTIGRAAPVLAGVLDRIAARSVIVVEPGEFALPDGRWSEFEDFLAADSVPGAEIDVYRDLAHIAYTGGTTGRSKGVLLPHRNVVVNAIQYTCSSYGARPGLDGHGGLVLDQSPDRAEWPVEVGTGVAVSVTPLFHAMGTTGGLNGPVLAGMTIVMHERFDPAAFLADAQRLRVTTVGGAPALFAALLSCPDIEHTDLSSVRSLGFGAAPMPVETFQELRARFPNAVICEGYGMTEVTMSATLSPANRSGVRKIGKVGIPTPDTEVKIVPAEPGGDDADDAERPLPAGERGEICVRGPQVMTGYLNRPEATAAALVGGWLHTGDIGVLDEDGYLSIVDRKKDMLLYKGYNVFPREIEELLVAQPGVRSAAVVGRPDPAVGELPVAFVVRSANAAALTGTSLMAEVNERLVHYKRLREVHFVDELPISAAGKVLKRELVQRLN